MAEAADRYRGRFAYRCRTGVIHDPVQMAHVQFLEVAGDPVFVELVCPDGPDSRLQNAAARGGGIHHVCYATADIDAACVNLRRNGMSLVRAPAPAVAFHGRRIAWLMDRGRVLTELVEEGPAGEV